MSKKSLDKNSIEIYFSRIDQWYDGATELDNFLRDFASNLNVGGFDTDGDIDIEFDSFEKMFVLMDSQGDNPIPLFEWNEAAQKGENKVFYRKK